MVVLISVCVHMPMCPCVNVKRIIYCMYVLFLSNHILFCYPFKKSEQIQLKFLFLNLCLLMLLLRQSCTLPKIHKKFFKILNCSIEHSIICMDRNRVPWEVEANCGVGGGDCSSLMIKTTLQSRYHPPIYI
jgi:hypothetical protein